MSCSAQRLIQSGSTSSDILSFSLKHLGQAPEAPSKGLTVSTRPRQFNVHVTKRPLHVIGLFGESFLFENECMGVWERSFWKNPTFFPKRMEPERDLA